MCRMEVVQHPECAYDTDERMTLSILAISCVCAFITVVGILRVLHPSPSPPMKGVDWESNHRSQERKK